VGIFCKGLHCAGCGKGIPLGALIVLILFVIGDGSAIPVHALEWWAVGIVGTILAIGGAAGAIASLLYHKAFVIDYSHWDTPTYVQQKEMAAQWPNAGRLEREIDHTVPLTKMVNEDTWT
jgi:hypothetical protein